MKMEIRVLPFCGMTAPRLPLEKSYSAFTGMAFEQLPDPGGDQHDARDQREVRVPVAEDAHARALLGLCRDELVRGAPVLAVEIAPPQRRHQHYGQHDPDQPFAFEAPAGSPR